MDTDDGDMYKMSDEEFNLFDAEAFMIEHDCYISKRFINADGSVNRDIIERVNEYPFTLYREKTGSSVFITILAFDSNHVMEIIADDFPGWEIMN